MTTTVLNRPTLRPLPGPRPGALLPAHLNPRPCATNPYGWWETGSIHNAAAIRLCGQCPKWAQAECAQDPDPVGVIRAGVAYDNDGKPMQQCPGCDAPRTNKAEPDTKCIHCGYQRQKPPPPQPRANPADHHQAIADMRADGRTWLDIAKTINAKPSTVRRYWSRHTAAEAREAARKARLPEQLPNIDPNKPSRPSDHHQIVVQMLSNTERNYTHREVAWVIGSTVEAVRSYWHRWSKEQQLQQARTDREQVAA